jgi:hypothetical protein
MSERDQLDAAPPECPKCGQHDVVKVVSTFTAIKDWRTT